LIAIRRQRIWICGSLSGDQEARIVASAANVMSESPRSRTTHQHHHHQGHHGQ